MICPALHEPEPQYSTKAAPARERLSFYYRVAMRTTFQPLAAAQNSGWHRRGERYSRTPGRPRSIAHRLPPRRQKGTLPLQPQYSTKAAPGKGAAFAFIIGWRCVPPSSRWPPFRSPDGSGEESGIPVHPAGQGVQPVVCRSAGRKEHSHSNPNAAQKPPRQGSGFHLYYRVAMRTTFQPLAVFRKSRR